MRNITPFAAGLLFLSLAAAHAEDDPEVRVRTGDHPGFGRVVFDFQVPVTYRLTRDNGLIHLQFDHAGRIGSAASTAHNVQRITGGDSEAEIRVSAGTRIRPMRVGTDIVIDVLDPEQPTPAGAASPSPAAPAQAAPPPSSAPTPAAAPELAAPAKPPASASPADDNGALATIQPTKPEAPATAQHGADQVAGTSASVATPPEPPPRLSAIPPPPGPVALVAARLPAPPGTTSSTIALPFGPDTGLAAFRRGDTVLLVFDEPRPVDLEALRGDPVFGSAAVQLLPAAAVLRFHPPSGTELTLSRSPQGWTITAGGIAPSIQPLGPVLADREITFAAATPGRVVNVADPETGGMLLVGTQRQPGQAVLVGRRTAEFALLPSWQGLIVDPLADSMFLHVTQNGFLLGVDPGGLALAAPPPDEAAYAGATTLTRRYDFPPLSTQSLMQQLRADIDAAAAAPPLARGPMRREAARTMIALGLGSEAQAMLRLAAADDAREAENPDTIGLLAIAALLAGRDGEADGLADARLDGTDEIALWRAVRDASAREGSPEAASVFAATLPLLLSYPSGLRDRLLPLAAETMALNKLDAAEALLAHRPDDRELAFARGLQLEAKGDTDRALAAFDRLATDPDQLTRARAATRAVELRLATGTLDAKRAADALDRQLIAWRGDRRELALRLRVADLRAQSGSWREALALLRETETLWPDDQAAIHARLKATFAAFLSAHDADRQSPFDLVALIDENPDLLPAGEQDPEMAARLADRLLALDLPKRAAPVLEKLVQSASGAARAGFGARLAALRLREGDADGALATLAASVSDPLPAAIEQQRTLVKARAIARRGDPAAAAALLVDLGTAEADEARAAILEEAKDWPQAERALADYAGRTIPPDGSLNDAQRRTLLRLAGATVQAGDPAALAALRQREAKRMDGGPLGDMFRMLTAGPVQAGADIVRAGREIAFARSVPTGLKAMEPIRPPP